VAVLSGSLLLSLLFHGLLLALAIAIWVPRETSFVESGERVVTLFLTGRDKPILSSSKPRISPIAEIKSPAAPAPPLQARPPAPSVGPLAPSEEPAPGAPSPNIELPKDSQIPLILPTVGMGSVPPPGTRSGKGLPSGFYGRGEGKSLALRRYGGGAETEGAVSRGLRWLADHQDESGGWSAERFNKHCRHNVPCSGPGLAEFDVGVTALATLAFLGAGHLPAPGILAAGAAGSDPGRDEPGPYRRNVKRALEYLIEHQDGSGAFGAIGDNYLYNQALATFAMGEACALTGLARYRESVISAVQFSVSAQQSGGGWDYTPKPTGRNDLSITGWQIMALRSVATAGIPVPEVVSERLKRFLDVAVTPDGEGIYANLGQEAGRRGPNMVAVGLLSRLYLGAAPDDGRVRRAVERLLRAPPDPDGMPAWDNTFQSYYYWYTATLAFFHLSGEEWKAWNFFLLRSVLPLQSKRPHEEGSWAPEQNWVGVSGGRVYATAINILTLETYYRYEPIHGTRKS